MAAKRKYRWEEWFGRGRTTLVYGEDYHCSQSAMTGMIRNAAIKYGVRVRLTDTRDYITIEVASGALSHPDKIAVTG